jgi:uncharacterized repeat protein (TIGR03803 family)
MHPLRVAGLTKLTVRAPRTILQILSLLVANLGLVACGGSGGGTASQSGTNTGAPPPAVKYTVGGSISGLASGVSVTLLDNGSDSLPLSANGPFTFATALTGGSAYAITVGAQPNGQLCSVAAPSGSVAATNVSNIAVSCTTAYTIGGSISAPAVKGLILANGTGSLAVTPGATTFTMPQSAIDGTSYDLVVQTDPSFNHCTITNGTGAVTGGNVTGIQVTCMPATESVLYAFAIGTPDGEDPTGGLIQAKDGNFYGVTSFGGAHGLGSIYKVTPAGTESVLYSFMGQPTDGANPIGRLVEASDGNFYGVASQGGAHVDGAVFKITPAGDESLLYTFGQSPTDATYPAGGLIQASDGYLYGATTNGGSYGYGGGGAVYRLSLSGTETIVYSFAAPSAQGTYPVGGLLQASDGNFYGLTTEGGANNCGTAFSLTPGGSLNVLHSFQYGSDGCHPIGELVQGADGSFYGTTTVGGMINTNGQGIVFSLTATGTEMVLHTFNDSPDGRTPSGGLILGNDGNFYGLTSKGGANAVGTIYRIAPGGAESVLYSFSGDSDGGNPSGDLMQAKDGTLLGVGGFVTGNTGGVVFEVH